MRCHASRPPSSAAAPLGRRPPPTAPAAPSANKPKGCTGGVGTVLQVRKERGHRCARVVPSSCALLAALNSLCNPACGPPALMRLARTLPGPPNPTSLTQRTTNLVRCQLLLIRPTRSLVRPHPGSPCPTRPQASSKPGTLPAAAGTPPQQPCKTPARCTAGPGAARRRPAARRAAACRPPRGSGSAPAGCCYRGGARWTRRSSCTTLRQRCQGSKLVVPQDRKATQWRSAAGDAPCQ